MAFRIIKPSASLAPFVSQFWAMESYLPPGSTHTQRIIPNGFVEWTFYLDDQPSYIRPRQIDKSIAIVNGQQYGYYDIIVSGKLDLFSVVFSPYGASQFLNIPLRQLTDQSIPSDLILRKDSHELASKLYEAISLEARVQVMENYLYRKILLEKSFDLNRMAAIFDTINASKAHVPVEILASEACLSRKQFERIFTDKVGMTPKKYLRIIRFQHALHIKQLKPATSLTTLAMDCGYFDQSHMINDFRYFTGLSPKTFFADCLPHSDYFSAAT